MADARDVLRGIRRAPGVRYSVLVPNERGAELALEEDIDGLRLVVCASETFNRRNVRMSIDESVRGCEAIARMASERHVPAEVAIGVSFGCPFEGPTPEHRVSELARTFAGMGIGEISIADTVGMANPTQVDRLMTRLGRELSDVKLSLHIHNTRGLGFANVLAGLQAGIDTYDASIGGLGGCPVTPAATGNIPTEDLVNMCEEMGIQTGIDIARVIEASRLMEEFLDRRLPSHILLAGTNQQAIARHQV
jgi:hydroxymethylglutaryl-CoA lyase